VRQLLTLFSSKPNEQLNVTTTLYIRTWIWLNGNSVIIPFREVSLSNYIFLNVGMVIAAYLVLPIMDPRILPKRALRVALRTFAKLRLYVPCTLKFNLPNVSCIMYVVRYIFRKMANSILGGRCTVIRSG
jgi:hypothetical protein